MMTAHYTRPIRTRSTLLLTASFFCTGALLAQSMRPQVAIGKLETSSSSDAAALPEAPLITLLPVEDTRTPAFPSSLFDKFSASSASSFPSTHARERSYVLDLLGPTAFLAPTFESGIDTARSLKVSYPSSGYIAPGQHPAHGDVPEWGEGAQGYSKRYADRFGQGLVTTTSRYALAEVLRQDVTYHRCGCSGIMRRTGHAFVGAYVAHTRSGRSVPSLPAIVSPFIGSEVAVSAWYPNRFNTNDTLRISLLNYVAAPFKNLYGEFLRK